MEYELHKLRIDENYFYSAFKCIRKGQHVNGLDLFHRINCFASDKSVTQLVADVTEISSCRQNFYLY